MGRESQIMSSDQESGLDRRLGRHRFGLDKGFGQAFRTATRHTASADVTLTAQNTTYKKILFCPTRDGRVTRVFVGAEAIPAYTGTVLMTIYKTNASGATNIISDTNVDLESLATAGVAEEEAVSTTAGAIDFVTTDTIGMAVAVGATQSTAGEGICCTVEYEYYI